VRRGGQRRQAVAPLCGDTERGLSGTSFRGGEWFVPCSAEAKSGGPPSTRGGTRGSCSPSAGVRAAFSRTGGYDRQVRLWDASAGRSAAPPAPKPVPLTTDP